MKNQRVGARHHVVILYSTLCTGDVTGEVVYANYGRTEDFNELALLGVNVSGAVVIVRYGEIFRGDKVSIIWVQGSVKNVSPYFETFLQVLWGCATDNRRTQARV
jgi:hypothetical protein